MFLLLGTHGMPDGRLASVVGGEDGEDFYHDDKAMIEWLIAADHKWDPTKRARKDDIIKKGIRFTLINLAEFKTQGEKIDSSRLGEKLRSLEPTAVFLTYCWSENSVVKDNLDAEGITAALTIQDDHWKITGRR